MSTIIFLPVKPLSPSGPPITKFPVGFTYISFSSKELNNSFGIDLGEFTMNPSILLENVRKEVDRLNKLHVDLLSKANVEIFKGWAHISSSNSELFFL